MIVTKPKVVMRLFWESKDTSYDKYDRERYSKIRRITNKMPKEVFKKIVLKNNSYDFYRGFCFSQEIKEYLNETEYEILLAVIDNIKSGFYDGGKNDKEVYWKRKWEIYNRQESEKE